MMQTTGRPASTIQSPVVGTTTHTKRCLKTLDDNLSTYYVPSFKREEGEGCSEQVLLVRLRIYLCSCMNCGVKRSLRRNSDHVLVYIYNEGRAI